ncbi:MAG TPA: DUF3592 domain-containing protein [Flavisolibacter sp.]|jgi:hypothetical protein|nr:DUF3592 domain-containing protein [Flavisolibacter sp.]
MIFSKNAFFFLLFLLLFAPIVLPNLIWLLRSVKTTGKVEGIGQATGISLGSDTYAYISFTTENDTVYFQGKDDNYKQGDIVPLRYQAKEPEEAKVAAFWSLWGNTIAYCGVPLIFWVICFFAPDIVPKGAKVVVGKKPFLKVVNQNNKS